MLKNGLVISILVFMFDPCVESHVSRVFPSMKKGDELQLIAFDFR
jgi:hypothetical protein